MKLYKYTFKSPLTGSIHCDSLFVDTRNRFELNATAMARLYNQDYNLSKFLDDNLEDLTQYVSPEIKGVVYKLEVGDYGVFDGQMCLLANVWTTKELTLCETDWVKEYITGQYSDGWGEGLEQREWREDRVDLPLTYFDPEEGDWDTDVDYDYACFYVHPWNSSEYFIELQYQEEVETPDPEPVVHSARCDIMPSGGYRVRTVYRLDDESQVLSHIKNSGLLYSEEFYKWVENFGTFGQNTYLYLVVVNEGWCNKILPMLGVLYRDSSRANMFSIDAESGEVNLGEYMENESEEFFKELIAK